MDPAYHILQSFKPQPFGARHKLSHLLLISQELGLSKPQTLKLLESLTGQGLLHKTRHRYQNHLELQRQQSLQALTERHLGLGNYVNLSQDTVYALTPQGFKLRQELGLDSPGI